MSKQDAACYYCVGNIDGVLPTEDFICGRHRALLDDARRKVGTVLAAVVRELARKARLGPSAWSDPTVIDRTLQDVADAIEVALQEVR